MPITTIILSQQLWQMKANTDQHITIQNTVLSETKVSVIYYPN